MRHFKSVSISERTWYCLVWANAPTWALTALPVISQAELGCSDLCVHAHMSCKHLTQVASAFPNPSKQMAFSLDTGRPSHLNQKFIYTYSHTIFTQTDRNFSGV